MKTNTFYKTIMMACLLLICSSSLFAQRDKEFWFAAPQIEHDTYYWTLNRPIYLRLTAYDYDATVTISTPADVATFTVPPIPTTFTILAGHTKEIALADYLTHLECTPANVVNSTGLHIVADQDISVYYELASDHNGNFWPMKGKNALGKSFIVPTQTMLSNWIDSRISATNTFDIVATEDNTDVMITIKKDIVGHTASLIPFPVHFNYKGQTFSAKSVSVSDKLDGSEVTSNKPIAITVTDDLMNSASYWGGGPYGIAAYDAGGDQIIPLDKIGTDYIAVAGGLDGNPEKVFITATVSGTNIYQDGSATPFGVPMSVGETRTLDLVQGNWATYIHADQPVYASQMSGMKSEPGWNLIPQLNCNGSTSVSYVRTPTNSSNGVLFMLYTNGGQGSFSYSINGGTAIAGLPAAPSWHNVPGISGWQAATIDVTGALSNNDAIIIRNSTPFAMGVATGQKENASFNATGLFGYLSNFGTLDIKPRANNPCPDNTLQLSADDLIGATYSWTGPAGFSSAVQNPTKAGFSPADYGWYYLTVDNGTCSSYDSVYVGYTYCCVAPTAAITVNGSPTNPLTVCYDKPLAIAGSGAIWGKVYFDHTDDVQPYVHLPYTLNTSVDASMIGQSHRVCVIAAHDSAGTCADTVCHDITIIDCCVKPTASLLINGSSAPIDTVCYGDTLRIYGSGAVWGMGYIDSIDATNHFVRMPLINNDIIDGPATIGETHRICLIVSDDSAGACRDTICRYIYIKNCCTKPTAVFPLPDSFCTGSQYFLKPSGGAYGQIIINDTVSLTDGLFPVAMYMDSFPQGFPTDKIEDSLTGMTYKFCYVAYSDTTPGACTDTVCKYVHFTTCRCAYTPVAITETQTGPMSYEFGYDGVENPDFIQWYVDGSQKAQTSGSDAFRDTFTVGGIHSVCMHAGYIHPTTDGHAICCYRDTCVQINVDRCDIWRATDSLQYTYDSTDFHTVSFHYEGLAPTSITWSIDGDIDFHNTTSLTHHFDTEGHHSVCAYVIWSLHDSTNCCCLDTLCLDVDVSACAINTFHIERVANTTRGTFTYQVIHDNGYVTYNDVNWHVNNQPQPGGVSMSYTPTETGVYDICATYEYTVVLSDRTAITCHGTACLTDTLNSTNTPKPAFRSYPNPTTGDLIVEFTSYEGTKNAQVEIVDITGQVVMTRAFENIAKGTTQKYMDVSILPRGMYTLRMALGDSFQINKLVRK